MLFVQSDFDRLISGYRLTSPYSDPYCLCCIRRNIVISTREFSVSVGCRQEVGKVTVVACLAP